MQAKAQPSSVGCFRTRPIVARAPLATPARGAPVAQAAVVEAKASEPAALAAFEAAHAATVDECLSVLKSAATAKSVKPEVGAPTWGRARGAGAPTGALRVLAAVRSSQHGGPVATAAAEAAAGSGTAPGS
jgi:hypothetical protein